MAKLTTLADIMSWVKVDLGVPALCIELPDATIIQVIEDSIDYYQKHAYGEGVYEDYIPLNISAGVSAQQSLQRYTYRCVAVSGTGSGAVGSRARPGRRA